MRAEPFRKWWPAVVWAALILSSSGGAGSSAGTTERWITLLFGDVDPDTAFIINYSARKSAHVVAYGILGALNLRGSGKPVVAVLLALAVAVADEAHQATTSVRTGALTDVGIDLCGAVLGVLGARRLASRWRSIDDEE